MKTRLILFISRRYWKRKMASTGNVVLKIPRVEKISNKKINIEQMRN